MFYNFMHLREYSVQQLIIQHLIQILLFLKKYSRFFCEMFLFVKPDLAGEGALLALAC